MYCDTSWIERFVGRLQKIKIWKPAELAGAVVKLLIWDLILYLYASAALLIHELLGIQKFPGGWVLAYLNPSACQWARVGFLSTDTIDCHFELHVFVLGAGTVHCMIFSSLRGLYPVDASSISVVTPKNISRYCQKTPVGKYTQVENH